MKAYYSEYPFSQAYREAFKDVGGLCYGFCMDYARDALKHQTKPRKKGRTNYVEKAMTKYHHGEDTNYMKRIFLYQVNQFKLYKSVCYTPYIPCDADIFSVIKDNKRYNARSVIGLELNGIEKGK
jgi:hypothetical protein